MWFGSSTFVYLSFVMFAPFSGEQKSDSLLQSTLDAERICVEGAGVDGDAVDVDDGVVDVLGEAEGLADAVGDGDGDSVGSGVKVGGASVAIAVSSLLDNSSVAAVAMPAATSAVMIRMTTWRWPNPFPLVPWPSRSPAPVLLRPLLAPEHDTRT